MPPHPLAPVHPNIPGTYTTSFNAPIPNPTASSTTFTSYRQQQSVIISMENLVPNSINLLSQKWKLLCLETIASLERLQTSPTVIGETIHFRGRECVITYMQDRRPELRTQVAEKWKHLYLDAIRALECSFSARMNPGDRVRIRELEQRLADTSDDLYDALDHLRERSEDLASLGVEFDRLKNELEQVGQDKVNEKWRAEHCLRKLHRLTEDWERSGAAYRQSFDEAKSNAEVEKIRQRMEQQGRQAYYTALKHEVAGLSGMGEGVDEVMRRLQGLLQVMEENDPVV